LFLTNWLPDNVVFIRIRGWLVRPFLGQCGKDLRLGRDITFYNPSKISIGNNVYIAKGCWFSSSFGIEIGDQVLFGPYVVVASSNHTRLNGSYRYGQPIGGKIIFGKGCWVGSNCTITANLSVGHGVIIGANSIVLSSIPNDVLFAGNPGKVIKLLKE
jgi:acetyltransferase-like isoleucine patch superfamily enzyme